MGEQVFMGKYKVDVMDGTSPTAIIARNLGIF